MVVDVVMLTNTADGVIYNMTQRAIASMQIADNTAEFNVILVESAARDSDGSSYYYNGCKVVHAPQPFNYNQALNIGFEHLSGARHVVICNNDLRFRRGWFHELNWAMIMYGLDVASPVAPGWPPHEELLAGSSSTTFFGNRTSYEVAGWCFCITREALDAIRPFDERFRFEFQDVDMVQQLIANGFGKMALVRGSEVEHLLNKSHRLIENRSGMIEGAAAIYEGKYGK